MFLLYVYEDVNVFLRFHHHHHGSVRDVHHRGCEDVYETCFYDNAHVRVLINE